MGKLKSKISFLLFKLFINIIFLGILSIFIFIIFSQILYSQNIIISRYFGSEFSEEDINIIKESNNIYSTMENYKFDYSLFKDDICIKNTIDDELYIYSKEARETKTTLRTTKADYQYILLNNNREIVIRLPNSPEFINKNLREIVSFNFLSYIIVICSFFITSIICITIFLIKIKKELKKIEKIALLINENSLEFPEITSDIYEFNVIINSIKYISNEFKELLNEEIKQKKIQRFQIACLSHDIKTPLTVIKGNAELLQLDNLEKEQKECIDFILESSLTIENYIDLIIQYSKLYSSLYIFFEKIEVTTLLNAIKKEIIGFLTKDKVTFTIKNNMNNNDYFEGNFIHIKRSIINLIDNAYEYSKKEEFEIICEIYKINDKICFSIWSSGSIFSKYILENGGNTFFQDDLSRNGNHYGLGLSYVKEVSRQHKGDIILENFEDGSKVTLRIPRLQNLDKELRIIH